MPLPPHLTTRTATTALRPRSCRCAMLLASTIVLLTNLAVANTPTHTTQAVSNLQVDRTEVSIRDFQQYVDATGTITAAERDGGGLVYAAGWQAMPGWTWRTPFGDSADPQLPAVHINFDEAAAYCQWAGKRLPTDAEWLQLAYTESRTAPPQPFVAGTTYPYPTGATPEGANCLDDCGSTTAVDYSAKLNRGIGPAPVGTSKAGVNGLYDMGANVWEWTVLEDGSGSHQGTRGGSWWYGASQMHRNHQATKPRDMSVVYIGFRCVREQ